MPAYTSERTSIEFKNMTPPNTKPHGMARPRTRKSVQRHHVFYTPTTRSSFRLSAFAIDPSLASSWYFVCHTPLMISVLEPSGGVFSAFLARNSRGSGSAPGPLASSRGERSPGSGGRYGRSPTRRPHNTDYPSSSGTCICRVVSPPQM